MGFLEPGPMQAAVRAIQQLYPQVYHACHVAHGRRRSNPYRLSERDGALLAHVGPGFAETARDLARHLGVGASTLSASIARLERLGYLARAARTTRGGTKRLQLTELGQAALAATSVLDGDRLAAALATLTTAERRAAVRGLDLLARGCRALAHTEQRA